MATATKNPNDTFVVTLTTAEFKVLKRWGTEYLPIRQRDEQLAFVITSDLASKANDYRAQDGPKLKQLYEAATPAVQAQVDALLGIT